MPAGTLVPRLDQRAIAGAGDHGGRRLARRAAAGADCLHPCRLQARHLWLDTRDGTVTVREPSGRDSAWKLRNWLRHPWLVVLYLEADGTHATVLLAADSMERRGYRRLRYLLGVRTVGPDSAAVSG